MIRSYMPRRGYCCRRYFGQQLTTGERSLNEASETQRPGNGVRTLVGMLNIFGQRLFNDDPGFASVRI